MTYRDTSHDFPGVCCTDCLMLLANDDTSGTIRAETPEGEDAYRADVASRTEGFAVVPSSWPDHDWTDEDRYYGLDCQPRFRHGPFCDTCSSPYGGDAHPVYFLALDR